MIHNEKSALMVRTNEPNTLLWDFLDCQMIMHNNYCPQEAFDCAACGRSSLLPQI